MRLLIGIFAAALAATPALATPAIQPDLADWVVEHTDLVPAQVAIAGSDNLYAVEPLGAPAVTGEVIAHVRTEAINVEWRGAHGFQSWDAHVIFDCKAARMRMIRSASYPKANRQGEPKVDDRSGDWFSPKADQPAAKLLAAACDESFAWPLRSTKGLTTAGASDAPARAALAKDAATAASPAAETARAEPEAAAQLAQAVEPAPTVKSEPAALQADAAAPTKAKAPAVKRRIAPLSRVVAVATSCKRMFFEGARSLARARPVSRHAALASETQPGARRE